MPGPDYAARRGRLVRSLKSADVDALLVSGETNVRYLTGFTGDSSWLYVSHLNAVLISDSRYTTQISSECPTLDVEIRTVGQTMSQAAAQVVNADRPARLGLEADHLTVSLWAALEDRLNGRELAQTSQLTENLRVTKDRWEIAETRRAVHQAERGIAVTRAGLRPELTEKQIRYGLEGAMRDFGAVGPAFEPIVAVGPTSALPHAHAGNLQVQESPVLLIDWGAETASGYRSDLTRVFFTGRVTKKMQRVYEIVLSAQQAAIKKIRPGTACGDVDKVARSIIADAGFGKRFGHGLGHGVGLDIHESVRLGPTSKELLKPGMIVTVEPGIYLEGQFGVRIEDDVLVTRDGCEVMTSVPRQFEECIVDN